MAAPQERDEAWGEQVARLIRERRERLAAQVEQARAAERETAQEREQRALAQRVALAQLQGDGRTAEQIVETCRRAAVAARVTLAQRALDSADLRGAVLSLFTAGGEDDPDQLVAAGMFAQVLLERRGCDVRGVAVQARHRAGRVELLAVEAQVIGDSALVAEARAAVRPPPQPVARFVRSVWRAPGGGVLIEPVCQRARNAVALALALLDNRLTESVVDDAP
jgi:hypothetical protein